jgi:hypothetical protein
MDEQPLIGFSTGNDLLSLAIREFEAIGDGGQITVSHAFFAYKINGAWVILGENWDGFTQQSASSFLVQRTIVKLFRPRFDLAKALAATLALPASQGGVGSPYDYAALFGMIVVEFAHHFHRDVPNLTDIAKRTAYCSEKIVTVLKTVIPALDCIASIIPDCTDPENLARLCCQYAVNFEALGSILP